MCHAGFSPARGPYAAGVIDVREAAESVRHISQAGRLSVVQRSENHIVLDAGNAIVKCGTRDAFGIEAWACEHARALGVPAPEVMSLEAAAPIPHLALSKVAGVPLCDSRLSREAATRGARQAGRMLRRLHGLPLPGFGWTDRDHFLRTTTIRGKSASWVEEINAELLPALDELVATGALATHQADRLRAGMRDVLPAIAAIGDGRFLHGDLGRMHIFVHPDDGRLTGFIDWADLQIGDPVWDLAITACHFASPSEGILRIHRGHQPDLFPYVVEGYEPQADVADRLAGLGSFYLAYRHAWVARLGPGEGGVGNPSLAMLRRGLDDAGGMGSSPIVP